jgi:hypothetical protein
MPVDTLDWAENDESDGRALRIFDSPAAPWPPCNRAHTTPDGEKKKRHRHMRCQYMRFVRQNGTPGRTPNG